MKLYKVYKSRKAENENPIVLQIGEEVKCMESSDPDGDWPNWVLCKNSTHMGWVPVQIMDEINNGKAIITKAYNAVEFDLSIGEVIESEEVLNGWVWGQKSNSRGYGWAPLNHLMAIENNKINTY